ncbi:hypothetical protein DHEL01_v209368 [Diaporthe helianthi]|uniref:Secreted protein n=1 Tax=Diaporthe helianthi TaxID=158607 RepID=A0A2P5HPR6_DIAHE|nr:hypothetical protein DHEL01_v209368 [Diaporthe helianthi]
MYQVFLLGLGWLGLHVGFGKQAAGGSTREEEDEEDERCGSRQKTALLVVHATETPIDVPPPPPPLRNTAIHAAVFAGASQGIPTRLHVRHMRPITFASTGRH